MSVTFSKQNIFILGIVFILLCSFWGVLFLYSVHSGMPYTAIQLPFEKNIPTKTFMPQGWKFFTRNPREEDFFVYSKDSDGIWRPLIQTNGSPEHFFGLSRVGRAKSVEMGMLLKILRDSDAEWSECKDILQKCADTVLHNSSSNEIVNSSPDPHICGDVVFNQKPPIPWAWSTSKKKVIMPSKIIEANVLCQK